jgi:hypothetical protein
MLSSVAECTPPQSLKSDDRATYDAWRRGLMISYVFSLVTLFGAILITVVVR